HGPHSWAKVLTRRGFATSSSPTQQPVFDRRQVLSFQPSSTVRFRPVRMAHAFCPDETSAAILRFAFCKDTEVMEETLPGSTGGRCASEARMRGYESGPHLALTASRTKAREPERP